MGILGYQGITREGRGHQGIPGDILGYQLILRISGNMRILGDIREYYGISGDIMISWDIRGYFGISGDILGYQDTRECQGI